MNVNSSFPHYTSSKRARSQAWLDYRELRSTTVHYTFRRNLALMLKTTFISRIYWEERVQVKLTLWQTAHRLVSLASSPIRCPRSDSCYCQAVAVLMTCGALSEEEGRSLHMHVFIYMAYPWTNVRHVIISRTKNYKHYTRDYLVPGLCPLSSTVNRTQRFGKWIEFRRHVKTLRDSYMSWARQ